MTKSALARRFRPAFLVCVLSVRALAVRGEASGEIRAAASTGEGFTAALDLTVGSVRVSGRLVSAPGKPTTLRFGLKSPSAVAGPARHAGMARVLADPCADAYLFLGPWRRPLALDFDSARYGAFVGRASGVWAQDAQAPRLGVWAGTPEESAFPIGAMTACSFLPGRESFDSWFSDTPAVPDRPLAAGLVWAGYSGPAGRLLAVAAYSEEDRGDRGWAARAEWAFGTGDFLWRGRASGASRGWKGLGGERADLWEARADATVFRTRRLRLEGRARAGVGPDGSADWEALARSVWTGPKWEAGAELAGSDASADPPLRLDPAVWIGYDGAALRADARASLVRIGTALDRLQLDASAALGSGKSAACRLDGAFRLAPEGFSWKVRASVEIPGAQGAWSLGARTEDWIEPGRPAVWYFEAALRLRFP